MHQCLFAWSHSILMPQVCDGDMWFLCVHLVDSSTGGVDFFMMNRTLEINNTSVQEVSVRILDDLEYEGIPDEQFMVVASLEGATFEGRVKLFPNSVIIAIEDNEAKPGK